MYFYIAGPMTSHRGSDWNYPAFNRAAEYLRAKGYQVCNPAENFDGRTDLPRATYLREAVKQVADSGTVVVLPGWYMSDGAMLEVEIAKALGIPVVPVEDLGVPG